MKKEDKNQRAPVGAGYEKSIRRLIGKTKKLDTDYYQKKLGEDFRVVWIVDRNNDLNEWLSIAGVSYVEDTKENSAETGRVRVFCGQSANGSQEWQYALSVPSDIYDDIIAMKNEEAMKPVRQMQEASRLGTDNESGIRVSAGTYAPNLPDGSYGMSNS